MSRQIALRCARRVCLGCACAGSVAFAAIIWWFLIPPETLASASTHAALALLGLFTLPALATSLAVFERKHRKS